MVALLILGLCLLGTMYVLYQTAVRLGHDLPKLIKNLLSNIGKNQTNNTTDNTTNNTTDNNTNKKIINEEEINVDKQNNINQPISSNGNYLKIHNATINLPNKLQTKNNIVENNCKNLCDEKFDCRFYDYDPNNKLCKIYGLNKKEFDHVGTRRLDNSFMIHVNKTSSGNNILNVPSNYLAECEDLCKNNKNCHWYNWNLKTKNCQLQRANYKKNNIVGIKPRSSGQ